MHFIFYFNIKKICRGLNKQTPLNKYIYILTVLADPNLLKHRS